MLCQRQRGRGLVQLHLPRQQDQPAGLPGAGDLPPLQRELRGGGLRPRQGLQDEARASPVRLCPRLLQPAPQAAGLRLRRLHLPRRVRPADGPLQRPPRPASDVPGKMQKVLLQRGVPRHPHLRRRPDGQRPLRDVPHGPLPRAHQPGPCPLRQQQRHLCLGVPPPAGHLPPRPLHRRAPLRELLGCGQILRRDGQRGRELRVNPPSPRGRTGRQGHYVYIVQTIYLIFIKIKRSLFIPVYVMQLQGTRLSVLPAREQGRGLPACVAGATLRNAGDAPVPGTALCHRHRSRCPQTPSSWRPVLRGDRAAAAGPPACPWPAALGLFIFGLNSWDSADVSGRDLEV